MNIALTAVILALCVPGETPQGGIAVDKDQKTVRIPAKIAPRKLPNLPEIYPIEVVATWPSPKGVKAHETIVNFDVTPSEVHKALESLGLKAGKPGRGEDLGHGAELEIYLDLPAVHGRPAGLVRIEQCMVSRRTGRPLPNVKWLFTGSALKDGKYAADTSGTLIGLYPVTDELVMQSGFTMREEGMMKVETNKAVLPGENTPVALVIKVASGPPPAAAAVGPDPEKQVTKLSRSVGPGDAPAPTAGPSASTASSATADPFEHRKEVRLKGLQDSTRPIDAPAAEKK